MTKPTTVANLIAAGVFHSWQPAGRDLGQRIFRSGPLWRKRFAALAGSDVDFVVGSSLPRAGTKIRLLVDDYVAGRPLDCLIPPDSYGMIPVFQRCHSAGGVDYSRLVKMKTTEMRTIGFFATTGCFIALYLGVRDFLTIKDEEAERLKPTRMSPLILPNGSLHESAFRKDRYPRVLPALMKWLDENLLPTEIDGTTDVDELLNR